MSQKHERARHEALARETAAARSWTVQMWFVTAHLSLMPSEPFQGPDMVLEFACLCSSDRAQAAHLATLDRHCIYVDRYERDPDAHRWITNMLRSSMRVKGSAYASIDRSVELENEDGVLSYRVRIDGERDPRAWFAVQKRYIEAVERHARPERWAVLQRPYTPERPVPPVVFALRGKQAVGLIMPMTCPGSGMEAAPPAEDVEVQP
jgi:hypothetical protein